jgi:hypothetical protein
MPLTVDQLRRATEPGDLPADVAAQVLVDFAGFARGEGSITLDQAFGVCVRAGGEPWFVTLARDRRDDAIRKFAETICPGGAVCDRIDALRVEFRRFGRGWSRGRFREVGRLSNIDRSLFDIFGAGDSLGPVPESPDHLRKILGSDKPLLQLTNQFFLNPQVS